MKKGVIVINTARGAVIDENALVKALESGQVSSCGLDVFEEEPTVHPGLLANPYVMLLPHVVSSLIDLICKGGNMLTRGVRVNRGLGLQRRLRRWKRYVSIHVSSSFLRHLLIVISGR